ncbi:hypothetical protein SDC9_78752 [bioreactor metagenome]|uniref:Uncharacterized protein n=1 Tax=bioreactor metagenome TaxID=1076179 RepID=A0A644Z0C5_9ZZZZ
MSADQQLSRVDVDRHISQNIIEYARADQHRRLAGEFLMGLCRKAQSFGADTGVAFQVIFSQ